MKRWLSIILLAFSCFAVAQKSKTIWKVNAGTDINRKSNNTNLPEKKLYDLDLTALQDILVTSPKRSANARNSNTLISLPNAEGVFENFSVYENSVMAEELAANYPEIKSYVAIGVENPGARVYFSYSPLGFKSMTLHPGKAAVFIEPLTTDLTTYTVYQKSDYANSMSRIECKIIDEAVSGIGNSELMARPNADDARLRTFRLALSCAGEYTAYFGGTKALALAGMNNTLTRCNAIFETDFGLRLVLIANNDNIIYTSATTDPYADYTSMSSWNSQLQSTLTSVIGEANYDIGHLLGGSGGGGNAGCIGCICVNGSKGKGYTSPSSGIPAGDNFDIDYVAHEIGHQLGANHTYSHVTESGTGAQMEPGSGSTIMSYAGITTKDVQRHSDPYFHAISIQQVTNNIKNKVAYILTSTGNNVPVVNAGLDYTIPKGTPFMLNGIASDANGDMLTYNWEEMDLGTSITGVPSATATAGPIFRSYVSTTSPTRYFPKMATVLSGLTTTAGTEIPWEVLPNVARTLNFRLTVRDNRAGGPSNNSDDVIITVNGTAGPFAVSSPNSAVTYSGGSTQTIAWNVAETTANGVNCANVDILLSTDGGQTFPVTILSATPNDGTQNVVIPNIAGSTNRVMIKGNNHIFFDVSNANFTISSGIPVADIIAPIMTILSASGTTVSSTNLSWSTASDNVGVTGYDIYQNGIYKASITNTAYTISGLSSATNYSFYVIAKDAAGNRSVASNTVNVITLSSVDTIAPTSPILSASGTTVSSTNLSWTTASDNVGVTGYDIYKNSQYIASTTVTTYVVNGLNPSTTYSYYVRAKDAVGNASSSNSVSITTLTNVISYCTSRGNSTAKEYMNRVQIGAINNLSGNNNGYGNFTSLSTNLALNSNNNITITPTKTSLSFAEAYSVWIDFNQDNDFTDAGELVINQSKTKSTPFSGNITVPSSALLGATRMRVSMKNNALATACEIFTYGEVEDYTVIITATGRLEEETIVSKPAIKIYPNPVSGEVLNISNLENPATFRIYNLLGQVMANSKIENDTVNVSSLKAGNYIIEIIDGDTRTTKQFIKQ